MKNSFTEIESFVSEKEGSYKGLSSEALLTSEEDFRLIFESLPLIHKFVDLGSGHGLGPLLFAQMFPDAQALGIEFERARVEASLNQIKICSLQNVNFICEDLLHCEIPEASAYFLYFPTGPVLDRVLCELKARSSKFLLIAIESHGDFFKRLKKESWLTLHSKVLLKTPRHEPYAHIYQNDGVASDSLHDLSFVEKFLLIEDSSNLTWLAESLGLEGHDLDQYNLKTPPRTIEEKQVKKRLIWEEIPAEFHPALRFRRLGSIRIETQETTFHGSIRKIFVSPSFRLEISSGEQVEWSEIKKIFWENTLCYDTSLDYFYFPLVASV